jgi:serine phosphatase RsbU (regulator of sigma subunit)
VAPAAIRFMYYRIISAFCVVFFMAINSPVKINGQSLDSLLYLLDNNLFKDDADKYGLLCKIISKSSDADSTLRYCDEAIKLAEEMEINPGEPCIFQGENYLNSGFLVSALEYFIKAANYYKADHNNEGLASAYLYIAETYNLQEDHNNETLYLKNAIEIYKEEKDSVNLAQALHNLGYAKFSMGLYDTALVLFSTTGEIFQKLNYPTGYAYCIGNSGLVYSRQSEYDKAEDYLLRAIEMLTRYGDDRAVTQFMIEYANVLDHEGKIKKAIATARQGFSNASKNDFKEYIRDAAQTLTRLYKNANKYDSAFYFQSVYIVANDSLKNVRNIQKMANMRTEFEVAEGKKEVEILQKNKFFLRIINFGLVVILLLAVGLILLYYVSLKRSRKLSAALEERREELEKQSLELKEKNDRIIQANEELKQLYQITNSQKEEIISSINYAQRIQKAVLPPETYITELINENFIFYKPKEIVSGDFYWIKQINHYIILVSADCTGHGVPGALMSMLGISYLNEIVQRKGITLANQILNELRKEIKHSLRQTGKKEESRDGIDMALCVIDTENSVMQYAGAFSPLYIISNIDGKAELKEFKADMMPVGVYFSTDKSFTNHEIKLEIGDTFYISTDGFIDQIGGSNDTRFGSKNFKKLLLDIHDRPLFEQNEILEQTLKDWMGEHPQRDDILVIGARI